MSTKSSHKKDNVAKRRVVRRPQKRKPVQDDHQPGSDVEAEEVVGEEVAGEDVAEEVVREEAEEQAEDQAEGEQAEEVEVEEDEEQIEDVEEGQVDEADAGPQEEVKGGDKKSGKVPAVPRVRISGAVRLKIAPPKQEVQKNPAKSMYHSLVRKASIGTHSAANLSAQLRSGNPPPSAAPKQPKPPIPNKAPAAVKKPASATATPSTHYAAASVKDMVARLSAKVTLLSTQLMEEQLAHEKTKLQLQAMASVRPSRVCVLCNLLSVDCDGLLPCTHCTESRSFCSYPHHQSNLSKETKEQSDAVKVSSFECVEEAVSYYQTVVATLEHRQASHVHRIKEQIDVLQEENRLLRLGLVAQDELDPNLVISFLTRGIKPRNRADVANLDLEHEHEENKSGRRLSFCLEKNVTHEAQDDTHVEE